MSSKYMKQVGHILMSDRLAAASTYMVNDSDSIHSFEDFVLSSSAIAV